MDELKAMALTKYQNNLAVIHNLLLLGGMSPDDYLAARASASRLWQTDQEIIELLVHRQSLIEEDLCE